MALAGSLLQADVGRWDVETPSGIQESSRWMLRQCLVGVRRSLHTLVRDECEELWQPGGFSSASPVIARPEIGCPREVAAGPSPWEVEGMGPLG